MFYRLGLLMYRRRRLVILLWLGVLGASLVLAPRVQEVLRGGGFENGTTDAVRALSIMQKDLRYYPSAVTIVFSSRTLQVSDRQFQRDMVEALSRLCDVKHLQRVDTYLGSGRVCGRSIGSFSKAASLETGVSAALLQTRLVSSDQHQTYAVLNFSSSLEVTQTLLPTIQGRLHARILRTAIGGDPSVYADMERLSTDDLSQVERYTFPVALILLIFVFGTLVAAGVPLLIGGCAVVVTLALIYLLGRVTPMSTFALNTTTMIGLGIGIDYALLIVSRYREEIARRPVDEAIAVTMQKAGRAVLFSGGTVVLGLGGLLMFQATALRSMGIGGDVVVVIAVLAALTLVPAVLGVLGERVNRLAVLPHRVGDEPFWSRLADAVMRHPWRYIVATLTIILLIASPSRFLKLTIPDATILPKSVVSRQVYDTLQRTFKVNVDSPTLPVVYGSGPILQRRNIGALYAYAHRIQADRDVLRVDSIVTLNGRLTRDDYLNLPAHLASQTVAAAVAPYLGSYSTLIVVYPRPGLSQGSAEALVRRIRSTPIEAGLRVLVGGYTAAKMDYINDLYSDFPKAVLFVLGSTFLVLLVLFRSVVLPLKAVLMNVLSLLGSYGALVFIFQEGHLSGLLHFSATGYIDEITPIVMFCTLFGLSMDYEVFLLVRIREEYLATGDNERAVAIGLGRTGRIITSAALILVVVAGSFAFTNLVLVKAVGLGLALAIVIDATLIRSLLVPATMRVLGRWNWWAPASLQRLLSRIGTLD